MLGIWKPNWDQLESILAARGKIRLLSFEYRPLGVNYGPLGVNFLRLWIDRGPLGVDLGPIWVNFGPLVVEFGTLRVDFMFFETIWASRSRWWVSGNRFWSSKSQFLSLGFDLSLWELFLSLLGRDDFMPGRVDFCASGSWIKGPWISSFCLWGLNFDL